MRIILFLLCFIKYAHSACVPGSVPCENAGIENFKVQAVDPTFTASPGEKGLFNTNSQFKTKDEFGNIQRLVNNSENILSQYNGDLEEGLTGFAGIGTLNTATPLMGLKSLTLDTTAINDFAETVPYLLKPGFNGQNCMGQVLVSPTDGNLSASVINADGTTVVTQVIAASTNNQTIHLQFGCPPSSATVNQRTLKVRVFQTTATNAAAVNLDSFYLGLFSADRLSVVEGSQWYFYTLGADINAQFPFPAPQASKNDKTIFTYAGTTLSILKPSRLSFNVEMISNNLTSIQLNGDITCIISGVSRKISTPINTYNAGAGITSTTSAPTIELYPGDTCVLNMFRNAGTVNTYIVNITATPLPSLASLVASPNLPAGRYGTKINSTCNYNTITGSAVTGTDFTGSGCSGVPNSTGFLLNTFTSYLGFSITKAQTNGIFAINFKSAKITLTGDAYLRYYNQTTGIAIGQTLTFSSGIWSSSNVGLAVNDDIRLRCFSASNTGTCDISINIANISSIFDVYWYPDLSSPYNQSIIAALPPQVINSSGKIWRTESCYITNNGTAAMASSSCNTFIQSVNRTAGGDVTINFISSIFSQPPQCVSVANYNGSSAYCPVYAATPITTASARVLCYNSSSGVVTDSGFFLMCQGFQ